MRLIFLRPQRLLLTCIRFIIATVSLYCEDVDLAGSPEIRTPLYVYSAGTILDHYRRLDAALAPLDHLICYAVKANSNRAILKLLADAGAGFDIVSGGELFRVLAAGGDPKKCTFAGVGKSSEEIEYALDQAFTASMSRAKRSWNTSIALPAQKNCARPSPCAPTPMSIRTRIEYISTGSHENKFGIALDQVAAVYERAAKMRNIDIVGVQMHIGSQITETKPFAERDQEGCAARSRIEIEVRHQVFQHRWRHGNYLPPRA